MFLADLTNTIYDPISLRIESSNANGQPCGLRGGGSGLLLRSLVLNRHLMRHRSFQPHNYPRFEEMPRTLPSNRSRQKSCVACAGGKRRCDRQTPQCSRCLARGLECIYIRQRQQQRRQSPRLLPWSSSPPFVDDIPAAFSPDDFTLFNDTDLIASWLTPSPSLSAVPTLLPAGYFPETSSIDKWSTQQLLQSIKSYPRTFARSRRAPFIHHRLYDVYLPEAIQDAFTVSASYYTRTPETEDTIFRIMEAKTANLLNQHHPENTLEELLAVVQALLIFHIIQLFDGDIRQRSLAEQNMDTLRAWTMQLQVRTGELGPAAPTWREWILAESIRRTVIVSILIEGLYSVLKVGRCTIVRALSILPFTSGATLWDLTTDASWLAQSHRLGSDTVLYGDFARAFENGRVLGKLDAFEKTLLAPCLGERYRDILKLED
ncbi:cop9 signalosome complex subunit [Aspergillus bombycis]|uniref:Cop9 signalosome complex subunit n=1 Tax=Aspergillus bombycis TaxID=109264 RepID=A0A1F7ZUH3_9EURO|nr:cop9 signalosome complex subunit [Aspergillus bombycis]OGM42929.1 cop9 signalosome complex subunit [Aspergillus bombycis]